MRQTLSAVTLSSLAFAVSSSNAAAIGNGFSQGAVGHLNVCPPTAIGIASAPSAKSGTPSLGGAIVANNCGIISSNQQAQCGSYGTNSSVTCDNNQPTAALTPDGMHWTCTHAVGSCTTIESGVLNIIACCDRVVPSSALPASSAPASSSAAASKTASTESTPTSITSDGDSTDTLDDPSTATDTEGATATPTGSDDSSITETLMSDGDINTTQKAGKPSSTVFVTTTVHPGKSQSASAGKSTGKSSSGTTSSSKGTVTGSETDESSDLNVSSSDSDLA